MRRRRIPLVALLAALLVLLTPGAAAAQAQQREYTGVPVAHRERVQVGPYALTVGVSDWPMRSQRSVNILFTPDGGIQGRHGTVTLVAPSGRELERELVRHPRVPTVWGLDIIALPEEGRWLWRLDIRGPDGRGTGSLAVTLAARPGPPAAVGWIPAGLVAAALTALLATAWRRAAPARRPEASSWDWVRPSTG